MKLEKQYFEISRAFLRTKKVGKREKIENHMKIAHKSKGMCFVLLSFYNFTIFWKMI